MKVRVQTLVGSGDRIARFTLPFLIVGLALNVAFPSMFDVGGPTPVLRAVSIVVLVFGIAIWIWSAALILVKVPRGELITTGPFALVRHPLYTGVSLLFLSWLGFLLNTWLGAALGIVMYVGTRLFAPAEDEELARAFGPEWYAYARSVRFPWL
jgi:protein-S-isoprenylcysteine O-methyltransferase Ste14